MNVHTSKFLSIAACSLIGCAAVCSAQEETNSAPLVTGVRTDFEYQPKGAPAPVPELRLQSDLVVIVEKLDDWADEVAKLKTNVTKEQIIAKLVPYIDDMALMGTYPASAPREPGSDKTTLIYRIARTAENKDTWTSLLERPGSDGAHREISFTLGTEAGEMLPSLFNQEAGGQRLQLMIVSSWWWVTAILLFLFVIGIYLAARYTDIIRDTDCQPGTGKRPYSLARFQMAVWLVLVVAAYLMIWMITRDRGDIPGTVLGLIGISSGTAVGALLIDANKRAARTKAQEAVTELTARLAAVNTLRTATPQPPDIAELNVEFQRIHGELATAQTRANAAVTRSASSKGFWIDLLDDGNGVSLHRLQILVWTFVLAGIFIVTVWRTLAMPEFSEGLLALMGISSGTYLGFKVPE